MDEKGSLSDEEYMQRTLRLAVLGRPSPNPYVGAVIVREGEIIGEGFHSKAGEAHAERVAMTDVMKRHGGKGVELLRGSTLYVNLEPCNHTGKTPPCSEAIVKSGISKVVFGMVDPNENVAGGGAKYLRENGVEVVSGVLEEQCRAVNAAYLKVLQKGLPLLTLKMACTMDGKTATMTGDSKWISSEKSREIVMKMRDKADAVIVGANTILKDDPQLTARGDENFRNPLRVIVDCKLRINPESKVFVDNNAIVAYCDADDGWEKDFEEKQIEIIKCPKDEKERVDLRFLLETLAKRGLNQVLCEGGATLAKSFLDADLIDVMILFYSPKIVGGEGKSIFEGAGVASIAESKKCEIVNAMEVGGDLMVVAKILHGKTNEE